MSQQKQPEKSLRQKLIDEHCGNQQCVGCPKEYECDEVDAELEEEDPYFGSDMQEDYP